jgi:hypothetical protein
VFRIQNRLPAENRIRFRNEPYLLLNIILAGVITMVMIYSGIFSPDKNDYPVECYHEKITGQPCVSCGLSHSFSLILRGRLDEAKSWNNNGLRVFIFFASQLLMRIIFSFVYLKHRHIRKELILMDSVSSAILFIVTFLPFLLYVFRFS